jgi:uncharacterized protein
MRSLTLTLTEQCNLACSYCYARHSTRRMSEAVVDAAVDFWLATARDEPGLNLSFYGGEPFLEPALMRRALARARSHAGDRQGLRCMTPTNGLVVDRAALDDGIELVVSIDAIPDGVERRHADGRDPVAEVLARLPDLLPHVALARMTVTPTNVTRLSQNVQAIARRGFPSIVFQPAWELGWDDAAILAWGREHARLFTWMLGARQAGARIPELPNLAGVLARLRRGKPRRACGAGVELAAVATDGSILPCYRFVFGTDCRLGDVGTGVTEHATQRAFAALAPDALGPEEGSCTACPASDGCTHYCPALGHLMCGDVARVPAVVCALTRAAVLALRPLIC